MTKVYDVVLMVNGERLADGVFKEKQLLLVVKSMAMAIRMSDQGCDILNEQVKLLVGDVKIE